MVARQQWEEFPFIHSNIHNKGREKGERGKRAAEGPDKRELTINTRSERKRKTKTKRMSRIYEAREPVIISSTAALARCMDVPDTARTRTAGNRGPAKEKKRKETREREREMGNHTAAALEIKVICNVYAPSVPLGKLSSKDSRAVQGLSSQSMALAFAQRKHGCVSARGGKMRMGV